jgi:RNA polymerase sigma factor (sigma-70 family)
VEVIVDDLEQELLNAAKRGDPSAGPFLVSYFGEKLLGYARAHAPGLADADREQIVELAIESGVRALDRFDLDKGSLVGWFRTQVRYQTLTWYRSHPAIETLDDTNTQDRDPDPAKPEPDRIVALRASIARLGHDDQVILAMRSAEGVAYAEVAQRLNISNDAARQRHVRALGRLRAQCLNEPAFAYLAGGIDDDEVGGG